MDKLFVIDDIATMSRGSAAPAHQNIADDDWQCSEKCKCLTRCNFGYHDQIIMQPAATTTSCSNCDHSDNQLVQVYHNKTMGSRRAFCSRRSLRKSASPLMTSIGTVCILVCIVASSLSLAQQSMMNARFVRQASDVTTTTSSSIVDKSEPLATATTTTTSTTTAAPPTQPDANSNNDEQPTRAASKIPPVNFTLVNEMFEAVLDESEVAQRWHKMDKTLLEGVRSILKIIFPHIVSMSSDAKVSGNCSGAILKWILNLRNLRTWAVQMLDAIGKPNAGILEGSLTLFGNYKQCLGIRAPDEDEIEIADGEFREYYRGQYCILQLRPQLAERQPFYSLNSTYASLLRKNYKYYEKSVYDDLSELAMAFNFVSIRADLCVPSLCSRDDIQRVADYLAKKVDMRARVQRCDVEPMEDQSQIEQSHLLWSMIFIILLLLVLISTLTSMIFKMKQRNQSKSKTKSIFTSMSVYRSLSHIKNVHLDRINDSKPVFLYSLRILITLWICLISLTSQLDFQFLRQLLSLRDVIMMWPMQLIVNSSLAYESLILLTAFTYSYQNINSNMTDLIKYNLSKYSRLMPCIMLFVALTIITPLLYPNRSPIWHDFVDEPAQVCKSNGFINVFFLQNFLTSDQICLPWTWIFCVELQLCTLAIPLIYLMNRQFDLYHGKYKLFSPSQMILIGLIVLGCVWNFANIYANSLPAAWFLTYPDKQDKNVYFTLHLYKTMAHVTTFAVGLMTGHLCRCLSIETFSGRPYGRRCCDNLIWAFSLATMLALIFSTHSWSLSGVSHLESPILSALYGSLAPLLWSVSVSMILFHLTVPNGKNQRSSLTQLLTCDVNLVRIGRLSFLIYLINPYVNQFVLAVQEQAIFTSVIMLGHTLIGNVVITISLSFMVSALVELPCRRIIKKLLIGRRRQCSNLDIISRQLNIHNQNQGPSHDSFATSANNVNRNNQYHSQQQQQMHNKLASNQQSVMIPLK